MKRENLCACKALTATVLIVLFSALMPSSAFGCSTPVFRYALERWVADYYDAVLLHDGALTEDEQKLLDKLRQENLEEGPFLNMRVLDAEITPSTEDKVKTLLMSEKLPEELPTLAIWYPWQKGRAAPFWQGKLTPSIVEALLGSPVRRKLAERLTEGQTTVWLFIRSGNAARDKAAFELLEKELDTITRELKEEAASIPEEYGIPKIDYEFSILRVSRCDPNESALLNILLGSEPDLGEYADQPVIFPVFGRGRALYAIIGEGITVDNIRETVGFLVGPCGCEIKMMNPGVDILMAANWDQAAMEFYEEYYETYNEVPEVTGVMPDAPAAQMETEEAVADADGSVSEEPALGQTQGTAAEEQAPADDVEEQKKVGLGLIGTTGIMLAIIVLLVVLGTVALSPRRKGNL